MKEAISIEVSLSDGKKIYGDLVKPRSYEGLVLFAHGSGSSRKSPRNQLVAAELQNNNYATLLMDLLTEEESEIREKVFDCELLATRLMEVALWTRNQPDLAMQPVALFGASTGAGAALIAAAQWPHRFQAVISRGGRPDLAKDYLSQVRQPTLFIVGGHDEVVLRLNRQAFDKLKCKKRLEVIPGATHLFEEPGKLEQVAKLSVEFLNKNIKSSHLPFENREGAALILAHRMQGRVFDRPVVVCIPRGGIVLGTVLADELHADLDAVVTRKLRHPSSPEWAMGAISEDGEVVLTDEGKRIAAETPDLMREERKKQLREIEKRIKTFRSLLPKVSLHHRTVILTDDGIATGSTVLAAVKFLRKQNPKELILSVPLAPLDSLTDLRSLCDEIICLASPPFFQSVGEFYRDFRQVDDAMFIQKIKEWTEKSSKQLGRPKQ
ncbi:MAG: phosphoribosyltransferase family protein [Pseudomonadota bacterium]